MTKSQCPMTNEELRPRLVIGHWDLVVPALLAISLGAVSPVAAQPNGLIPNNGNFATVEVRGTIVSVAPTSFVVKGADGVRYTADLARIRNPIPPAQVMFDRNESSKMLNADQAVRFEAEIQGRKLKSEITQIEIVGKIPAPQYGLTDVREFAADIDAGGRRIGKARTSEKVIIVGRVKKFSRGFLSVEFPDPERSGRTITLQAKVFDDAVVKLSDIAFAKAGDQVLVAGLTLAGDRRPRFWATQVNVTRPGEPAKAGAPKVAAGVRPPRVDPFAAGAKADEKKPKFRGKILKIN